MDYDYEKKYLKYKQKYLELCKIKNNKKFKGGTPVVFTPELIGILKQRIINIVEYRSFCGDLTNVLKTDSDNSLTTEFFNKICNNRQYAERCKQIKKLFNENNVNEENSIIEDEYESLLGVSEENESSSGTAALLKKKIEDGKTLLKKKIEDGKTLLKEKFVLGSALLKEKITFGLELLQGPFVKPKSTENNNIIENLIGDMLTNILNIIYYNMETEKLERSYYRKFNRI
jgi:hypothetical protein